MAVEEGQGGVGGAMDPGQSSLHPGPGLVEVHGIGLAQEHPYVLGELGGPRGRLADHVREGADGDLLAQHVGEELGRALEWQVLVHGQVGGQGPDPGP